ncbi:MAG TPA: threonine ammonia-lyase, biosynthetic [Candidatus Saccharimonadales bacterium]|jgi:threonine dehydratase
MNDAVQQTLLAPVYDVAIKTPLQLAAKLSSLHNNAIYLKREDMQPVHSFKIRGAYNKIVSLSSAERAKGIIAASAGNHAQGVASSAQKLGIKATIVMPRTTPSIKIDAVKDYGAKVLLAGDSYSDAYDSCLKLQAETGQTLIHPFDDPYVIAGQGTVGKEILEQLPDVHYIFVPVGGGGLIAGIAQYVKALMPSVKIIGVEPADSNAMQASLKINERVILPHVGIFADGVAVKQVGELTYELCRTYVDSVVAVSNDQICAATKYIFETTRSIVEPAGALSLAGALQYISTHRVHDKKIVTICSGANITFERLQYIAERTMLGSGRELLFSVSLLERPGALAKFCTEVVNGHNITEFSYRLVDHTQAHILVEITVSGATDRDYFVTKLHKHGYDYADLSSDDVTKEHIRHMIGGPARAARGEQIYEVNFPERPGALADFLHSLGNKWNISLFHYRGQGADTGKVLIGFETAESDDVPRSLETTGYEYSPVMSRALQTFL